MPSRSSYLLIVSGRLKGNLEKEKNISTIVEKIKEKFQKPQRPYRGKPAGPKEKRLYGAGWPQGFVLENYGVCVWSPEAEPYGRDETKFTFRAEVHHSRPRTLYDNRDEMLPEVKWFYSYRDYKWHYELIETLREVNEEIVRKELLIEPIWLHTYQWYCGNGGNH